MKDINIFLKKKTKAEKRTEKDIKILLKNRKKKRHYYRQRNKNLSMEQMQKLVEYRINYYITQNI